MKRTRKFLLILTAAGFSGFVGAPGPATAVEFRAGQHVVVAAGEVIGDDLYATGETVTVDGTVEGDLVASGRHITLNGEVTGDLIVAGQAVVVDGRVGDDIRMAGMVLMLGPSAAVADDVVAAGFSLETAAGSATRGSLLFNGFQALLAGDIEESLLGAMSALEIRGRVGGDSEIEVDGDPGMPSFAQYLPTPVPLPSVKGGLAISDEARIEGRLEYTARSAATGGGAGSGTLVRREVAERAAESETTVRNRRWRGRVFKWAGLLILGLLLVWWVPAWLSERGDDIAARPWRTAGLGLLGVVALPLGLLLVVVALGLVAAILGVVKLGGLAALTVALGLAGVGLVVLLFWLTASYLAPLLVGLCTGRWVLRRFAAERAGGLVLPLVSGLLVLALLRFVPILGFLVALAVLLVGWGAMLVWLWRRLGGGALPAAAA